MIKKIVPMESWGMLVLEIANFVVIYIVCIYLFGLNEAEKKQAKKAIVQLKRKICDEPRSSFGVQNDPEEDAWECFQFNEFLFFPNSSLAVYCSNYALRQTIYLIY